jgi:hypothetical protein
MRSKLSSVMALGLIALQSGCGNSSTAEAARSRAASILSAEDGSGGAISDARSEALSYSGTDAHDVPHYFKGRLAAEELRVLRDAFGIVFPSHLYISDSTKDGLLKYDPTPKPCSTCYVNSYRIGFVSIRRRGESWEDLERRTRSLSRSAFPASSLVTSNSVDTMDPDVQDEVRQMLEAARRAGFETHVVTTYRSPQQEALLMAKGRGRTHTLTSLHSYGRAIDVRIGDGNLGNPSTRRRWIAFRAWVTRFRGTNFRILGAPDHSWDWAHVELPTDKIGFRSVDAAIAAGRICTRNPSPHACEFSPHLPRNQVALAGSLSGTD